MIRIGIEDLIANALIQLGNKINKKHVTIEELENYCNTVIKQLNNKGLQAVYEGNRYLTHNFLCEYGNFFEEYIDNIGGKGFKLKEGVTNEILTDKFTGYLDLSLMIAFNSIEAKQVLGIR